MNNETHRRALLVNRIRSVKWIRLSARVTSLLSVSLLLLFLVGGGPGQRAVAAREWIGLLFFPFGVVVGMLVAWKREALGGFLSIGSLMCFYLVYGVILGDGPPRGWAFAMFTAPAFLFLLSGLMTKNHTAEQVCDRRIQAKGAH